MSSFCGPVWAMRPFLATAVLLVTFSLNITPAQAQLSPGDLSQAHAHLEGLRKCNNCHKLGTRGVGPKCLDCHTEIAAMRAGGPGLHAESKYADCASCHNEHQGRDYQLVFWVNGQKQFKHDELGYEMMGAHLKLKCRQCHVEKNMPRVEQVRKWHKDVRHTFLGLDQECLSCHQDPHDGALTGGAKQKTCTSCHDTNKWKPVPKFDHDTSSFPLTGKHLKVTCTKCHKTLGNKVTVGKKKIAVPVFKPQDAANCTACHQDEHRGDLGPNCAKCHNTSGWLDIDGKAFDHDTTHYPLEGRHANVSCADCHSNHRKKPAFAHCQDCHRDAHDSKRLARPNLMACEDCHTVSGFRPASFTMGAHNQTKFPLLGAHQATPCFSCHKPLGHGDAKSVYAKAADLAPVYAACTDCHRDPHLGQTEDVKSVSGQTACLVCHSQNSWRSPAFDHDQTKFALRDRHAQQTCTKCHKPSRRKGQLELVFTGLERHCAGCHDDVHDGEFAERKTPDGQAIDCAGCHVTVDWYAEKFDHDEDTRFALRGSHEQVACVKCHLPPLTGDGKLVVFKPLPTDCLACHGKNPQPLSDQQKRKL